MAIIMGNDEFILYLRKHNPDCHLPNDTLGRLIWNRIKVLDTNAQIIEDDKLCYWEHTGASVSETRLPKTSAQFRFNREILSVLYEYLDQLR